jgi:hypothetical protein
MFFNINFKLKYAGESINIDDEILENVDTDKFGKKKAKHYIRYRTKNMYNTFFKDESVTVQAQLLLCLMKSRKLKEATSLLGIQKSTKDTKVKQNVFNNITSVFFDTLEYLRFLNLCKTKFSYLMNSEIHLGFISGKRWLKINQ